MNRFSILFASMWSVTRATRFILSKYYYTYPPCLAKFGLALSMWQICNNENGSKPNDIADIKWRLMNLISLIAATCNEYIKYSTCIYWALALKLLHNITINPLRYSYEPLSFVIRNMDTTICPKPDAVNISYAYLHGLGHDITFKIEKKILIWNNNYRRI